MKSKEYTVLLIFNKENKKFIGAPASRCSCTAGNLFCGHMLAFILLLYIIQCKCMISQDLSNSCITLEDLINLMPYPITSIQTLPVPFTYIYGGADDNQTTKQLGNNISKVWKRNKSIIKKKNDDYDRANVVLEHIINEESKEEADLLCEEDKEALKIKAKDVLNNTLLFINKANSRVKDGADASIINCEQIEQYNSVILTERGPNATTKTKYDQLKTHQLLFEAYHEGKLKKNMLLHYVNLTVSFRLEMMAAIIENNNLIFFESHQVPINLKNIPLGWIVLADRGFAYDAIKYPNLNRHITPAFINKREQFTQEELEVDLAICQLRYISETHFARVTEESTLKDVVTHDYFPILQHIVDWANGDANLSQPFYSIKDY